jgi:acyl-[acyl carrier protein]--UDP-N-acetylglucosamine O-acyltransferase
LKRAYRILYREGVKLEIALERIASEMPGDLVQELVSFIRNSKRGICRE